MGQNEVSVKTNLYSSYVATKKTVCAKCGVAKKWTAAVDLQPTIPKSDRLLAAQPSRDGFRSVFLLFYWRFRSSAQPDW